MKRRTKLLIISSLILFSFYYTYDLPSGMNKKLVFNDKKFTAFRLITLYSAYAFPNIFVPLIFLQLKINEPLFIKILSFLVLFGQSIFTIGIFLENFYVMLIGRFVFGLGCESFGIIINKIISNVFRNKELSTSMGILVCVGRLGTILNFIITPIISEISIFYASIVGLSLTFCGFCLTFFIKTRQNLKLKIITYDKIGIENTEVNRDNPISEPIAKLDNPFVFVKDQTIEWTNIKNDQNIWIDKNSPVIEEDIELKLYKEEEKQLPFLIFIGMAFLFACVWAPFYNIGTLIFQKRYELNNSMSGKIMALLEFISVIMVIITGTIADKIGKRLYIIGFGALFLLSSHIMILLKVNFIIVAIILGITGPLLSSYWSCIVYLISPEKLGMAFAIIYSVLNCSYTFSPLFISYLEKSDNNYTLIEIYFIIISLFGMGAIILLHFYNKKYVLGLNKKTNLFKSLDL